MCLYAGVRILSVILWYLISNASSHHCLLSCSSAPRLPFSCAAFFSHNLIPKVSPSHTTFSSHYFLSQYHLPTRNVRKEERKPFKAQILNFWIFICSFIFFTASKEHSVFSERFSSGMNACLWHTPPHTDRQRNKRI